MLDAEKPLGEQRSAVDDTPTKIEPQESLPSEKSDDAGKSGDEAEKESKGSIRDYFVGSGRIHSTRSGLTLLRSDSEFSIMRTVSTVSCTRSQSQVLS